MSGLNEFDHEYYENYQEPQKDIIKISDLDRFEPSERHHIAVITNRRNYLKSVERRINFGQGQWNELNALNWVLDLIEGIIIE